MFCRLFWEGANSFSTFFSTNICCVLWGWIWKISRKRMTITLHDLDWSKHTITNLAWIQYFLTSNPQSEYRYLWSSMGDTNPFRMDGKQQQHAVWILTKTRLSWWVVYIPFFPLTHFLYCLFLVIYNKEISANIHYQLENNRHKHFIKEDT